MKTVGLFAAAVLLSGASTALAAPTKAPAKAATAVTTAPAARSALSQEQQEHAVQAFAVMSSAMRSDKVGNDVKSALMGCIYSNKLENISTAIDKVIAANPGKVNRTDPDALLGVMVAVCGYRPPAGATPSATGPAPAAPAPTGTTPAGR